jgi:hypothetical protein
MGKAFFIGLVYLLGIPKVMKMFSTIKESGGEGFLMDMVFIKNLMGIYLLEY